MIKAAASFSSFSVNDIAAAKAFYTQTIGLQSGDESMGLELQLPGGGKLFIYSKDDHKPATFTVLNFVVANIDETVDALQKQGVHFEKYEGFDQDEKGIARGISAKRGPDIAWFKDPAGNILSVLQTK